jgi:hypothetical protein
MKMMSSKSASEQFRLAVLRGGSRRSLSTLISTVPFCRGLCVPQKEARPSLSP